MIIYRCSRCRRIITLERPVSLSIMRCEGCHTITWNEILTAEQALIEVAYAATDNEEVL